MTLDADKVLSRKSEIEELESKRKQKFVDTVNEIFDSLKNNQIFKEFQSFIDTQAENFLTSSHSHLYETSKESLLCFDKYDFIEFIKKRSDNSALIENMNLYLTSKVRKADLFQYANLFKDTIQYANNFEYETDDDNNLEITYSISDIFDLTIAINKNNQIVLRLDYYDAISNGKYFLKHGFDDFKENNSDKYGNWIGNKITLTKYKELNSKKLIFNDEWINDLQDGFSELDNPVTLTIFQDISKSNAGTEIYVRNKVKFAEKLPNVKVNVVKFDGEEPEEITALVVALTKAVGNNEKIMMQKPCSEQAEIIFKQFVDRMPNIDVEGVSKKNVERLNKVKNLDITDDSIVIPCTALGNIILLSKIAKDKGFSDSEMFDGKKVLIIGRSEIVGKPLTTIFQKTNCTLMLANSYTENLDELCDISDYIISCVGKPDLVQKCKEGAVLVDNGVSLVDGKQHGDISKDLWYKSSYYTPYTGATGKATVFSLFVNLLKLASNDNIV